MHALLIAQYIEHKEGIEQVATGYQIENIINHCAILRAFSRSCVTRCLVQRERIYSQEGKIMSIARTVVLAAGLAATAPSAYAQVEVYSTFGPGNDYNMILGNIVLGEDDISIGNVDQAQPFTVGPVPTYFTNAQLALRHTGGTNSINIHLMSDAGGLPDTILQTMTINGVPGGVSGGVVQANPGFAVLMEANTTYWIIADAQGDSTFSWHHNVIGAMGKGGRSGNPPGPWNYNEDSTSLAFRVNGRLVPAPGATAMLATAMGFAARRRRSI